MEKRNPFKTAIKNYPFHNFEEESKFMGVFVETIELGDEEDKKFLANVFNDYKTGEKVFITNSYSIEKGIKLAKIDFATLNDILFLIEFLGKTMLKGKPFNQFEISYCSLETYEEFIATDSKEQSK